MKIPLDLVDAIEQMAEDYDRDFHNTLLVSLLWAAWVHSDGRGPCEEMMEQPGGFTAWDEKIRARRETRDLNRLYEISGEGE